MQLYAHDPNIGLIHALHAVKQKDYNCLECGQTVRLRSGEHRQLHFYHLQPNQACRLNAKSMTHIMVQAYLQSLLPEGEAELEYRFSAINRIADVAWITKKIVFEVQCSPITADEIKTRNADYASVGYQVIWLLHDSRYNQYRLSAAEDALRSWPHYYTDMNAEGEGGIYDQHAFVVKGLRKERLQKQTVDLSIPQSMDIKNEFNQMDVKLPRFLSERMHCWPMYFGGDCIDLYLKNSNTPLFADYLKDLLTIEAAWLQVKERDFLSFPLSEVFKIMYQRWIARPYRVIFRLFLERASK